ncbi:MAG: FkbM family methyltransferase [Flavobacteriales bacterium]
MKKFILRRLKITRIKIFIARILYIFTRLFIWNPVQVVKRGGITFELDIREGIDLHLFWFGNFQKHVYNNDIIKIPADAVIFDVGGNAGVMALMFAQRAPQGQVHSFEPTDYALRKFERNMELNPAEAARITVNQAFISSEARESVNVEVFSSWPVTGGSDKHSIHQGVKKTGNNIPSVRLDDYCAERNISRIDLIKIDTDGHEYEVLKGCRNLIAGFKPQIVFEIGEYVMEEKGIGYSDYHNYFQALGYAVFMPEGQPVTPENYTDHIPRYGTVDLVAIPASKA